MGIDYIRPKAATDLKNGLYYPLVSLVSISAVACQADKTLFLSTPSFF